MAQDHRSNIPVANNSITDSGENVNRKDVTSSETAKISSDQRFALRDDGKAYSYESLTKKKDISVITLSKDVPRGKDGKVDNKATIAKGKLNAKKQKNPNNTETNTYVYVDDLGLDVLIGTKGMQHGLVRSEKTAFAIMRIGDILKNSIAINELNGSDSRKTEMSYVLLGACQDENKIYAVRSVVSKLLNDVTDIDIWQLGAVKGKKTETPNSALKRGAAVTEQSSLISSGSPTISITDFLHIVKDIALINEVFSEDVAENLGVNRSDGPLSGYIRYALRDDNVKELFGEEVANSIAKGENVGVDTSVSKGAPKGLDQADGKKLRRAANNMRERVYSKKDTVKVIRRFMRISQLTGETREEITDALWKLLNSAPDIDRRHESAQDMAQFIATKIVEGATETNPDLQMALDTIAILRLGIGKISFSNSDLAEIQAARDNGYYRRNNKIGRCTSL